MCTSVPVQATTFFRYACHRENFVYHSLSCESKIYINVDISYLGKRYRISYAASIRKINKLFISKMNMQSFSKVPDQVGYLLLHESGATISSSGELENDEKTAEIIFNLISLTDKLDPLTFSNEGFNKISICYKDFCYIICMSNKKIHVVKRKMTVGLNQSKVNSVEPHLIDLQVPVNNSINA